MTGREAEMRMGGPPHGGEHGTPMGFGRLWNNHPPVGRAAANRGQMTPSPYGAGGKRDSVAGVRKRP